MNYQGLGNLKIYPKMLGKGSFGEVYLGFNRSNGRLVAVKTEHKSTGKDAKVLRHENDILKLIRPDSIYSWEDELKFYIAIPLLGPSLDSLHTMCNLRFSTITCLRLGLQMIDAVRHLHSVKVLHRDIKPANFLVDYQIPHKRIHLVDFGLSKIYTEGAPYKTGVQRVGSLRYMSKYTHQGIESDRRDDLYSIAYVLIYLFVGSLPWKGMVKNLTTEQKHQSILKLKIKFDNGRLCGKLTCPKFRLAMTSFLNYLDTLSFGNKPDYSKLESLLESCLVAENTSSWDWDCHFGGNAGPPNPLATK